MRIIQLTGEGRRQILDGLLRRSPGGYREHEQIVAEIIAQVREKGDEAVLAYTARFDGWQPQVGSLSVTQEEIGEAVNSLAPEFLSVMQKSADNIRAFHEKQRQNSWFDPRPDGSILGMRITPLERAGVYVPGGKAAYPSSVLMNVIPAKVAGVERLVMATPAGPGGRVDPGTLAAAHIAGVDEIYKVGGAQAIAALAFGTRTIPKVDKITGPGNIFVALAKKACFGHVGIDSIAGPSEILVIADETANPLYVASDLLSQAEHDELAGAILITTSEEVAHRVSEEVERLMGELPRTAIMQKSIANYGCILLVKDLEEAAEAANAIASEHLEILTEDPFTLMTKIRHAGAIFLGEYSSEPLGDYFAGPNHVLPTNGTARFFSPLGVEDFCKKTSIISYSRQALEAVRRDIELFAGQEGLVAHANSIRVRFADS